MASKNIFKYDRVNSRDSYDISGDGSPNVISTTRHNWLAKRKFPVFPTTFIDVCRRDRCWFKHINYPFMAIELTLDGAVEYCDGLHRQVAEAGMLFVIVRGSNVRIMNADQRLRRKMTLLISGTCISSIAESLGFHKNTLLSLSSPSLIENKMRRIGEVIAASGSPIDASQLTYELLLLLAEENRESRLPEDLQQVVELLQKDFPGKFTIGSLAERVGLSEATLRRRFAEYFSLSPLKYLNSLRMRNAVILLQNTLLPIKEVAFDSGFTSVLQFNIIFKKYYKQTPGDYRKNM